MGADQQRQEETCGRARPRHESAAEGDAASGTSNFEHRQFSASSSSISSSRGGVRA